MRRLAGHAEQATTALLGPWMSADDAVEYLGFPSRKALYQAVRRGQVPAHRLGRRLRFSRPELDAVLRRSRTLLVEDVRPAV